MSNLRKIGNVASLAAVGVVVGAAGATVLSQSAEATSSGVSYLYSYQYTGGTAPAAAVAAQVLSTVTSQVVNTVNNRIGQVLNGNPGLTGVASNGQRGVAGASKQPAFGLFASVGYTGVEDNNAVAKNDGGVTTGIVGGDYKINDNLMVGAALTVSHAHFDTRYNDGEVESSQFGIAPYIAAKFNKWLSFTGVAGYSGGEMDVKRFKGSLTGVEMAGETGVDSYFLSGTLAGNFMVNKFSLGADLGLLWAQSFTDAYTEIDQQTRGAAAAATNRVNGATVDLGQLALNGRAGYVFTADSKTQTFIEPYVKVGYRYDFTKTEIRGHENARHGFVAGGGVTTYSGAGLVVNLDSYYEGRNSQANWSTFGTVRVGF